MNILALALTLLAGFGLLIAAMYFGMAQARKKPFIRRDFIRQYQFPDALVFKIKQQYPTLKATEIDAIFEGLRQWFLLLNQNPKKYFGMPSRAVDAAWHAFILMTQPYESFCQQAFGAFVHHSPNLPGASDKLRDQPGLAMTYGLLPATAMGLFTLDSSLGIAGGNFYEPSDLNHLKSLSNASKRSKDSGGCAGRYAGEYGFGQGHSTSTDTRSDFSGVSSDGGGGGDGGSGSGGCGGGGCGS